MVLVDTSVWIRFLTGREPFLSGLGRLLAVGEVAGHELVFGELLIGDRGGRRRLLADYMLMQQVRLIPHAEVVEFVRRRRLYGRGAAWIDVHLLASAIVNRMPFWTADTRVAEIAEEFGAAFDPLQEER